MIENWLFVFATIAVLMIPGPANALVASSAYQQGTAKTSLYIPVILVGYLYAINGWALLVHLFSPIWPSFQELVHVLSAIGVGWMTFHLFKARQLEQYNQSHPQIRPWQMFKGTLKNPKAALLATGILPLSTWESPSNFVLVFAIFTGIALLVALFWMIFGQAILAGESAKRKADLIYKGSALLLLLCLVPLLINWLE